MRGNMVKIEGVKTVVRPIDAKMDVFDELPKPVREALASADHSLDAVELRSVARDRSWNAEQMVAAVKWLDARITSRCQAQEK